MPLEFSTEPVRIQTTDNTTIPAGNYPLPPDSVAFFECYVLARGSTGSAATFMCEYSLQRQGTADVTLLGTGRKDKEGTSPEPELDIVATGPNVEIQITGIAGVTFDWAIFGALTVLG